MSAAKSKKTQVRSKRPTLMEILESEGPEGVSREGCRLALMVVAERYESFLTEKQPGDAAGCERILTVMKEARTDEIEALMDDSLLRTCLANDCVFEKRSAGDGDTALAKALITAAVLHADGMHLTGLRTILFQNADAFSDQELFAAMVRLTRERFLPVVRALEKKAQQEPVLVMDATYVAVASDKPAQRKGAVTGDHETVCFSVVKTGVQAQKALVLMRVEKGNGGLKCYGFETLAAYRPEVWSVKLTEDLDAFKTNARFAGRLAQLRDILSQVTAAGSLHPLLAVLPIRMGTNGKSLFVRDFQGALDCIDKVAVREEKLTKKSAETQQAWLKRVQASRERYAAPAVKKVRELLEACVPAPRKKAPHYAVKNPADGIGQLAAFALNHWEIFERFLTDPRIPAANTALPDYVRAFAAFVDPESPLATLERLQTMAVMRTLIETARANGRMNVVEWADAAAKAVAEGRDVPL